ncbi:zinc finger protein 277-like isoform X2 [Simochromis diagramma]|nr:zinc finger protein 277-like isoform X2 [Simochromis diagramma]
MEHKLVIADVKLMAEYLLYWKGRFLEQLVTDFCSVIKTNSTGPVEEQEETTSCCVTSFQKTESSERSCSRNDWWSLLNHMAREHSFSIGLPDNIVYCSEFLDTLQDKLDSLQCLYCEKTFRDKTKLKDHMRKKAHRCISTKNHEYDRFYVINYLELGKTWEEVQSEDDRELADDEDDDWSDWQAHPVSAVCLFCDHQSETLEQIYAHMKEAHGFDLLKTELDLKFYQQVKLVNFIRRQIHQSRCYGCTRMFDCRADALRHIAAEGHVMKPPETSRSITSPRTRTTLSCARSLTARKATVARSIAARRSQSSRRTSLT